MTVERDERSAEVATSMETTAPSADVSLRAEPAHLETGPETGSESGPATGAAPRARVALWIAAGLLLLGALPDAMVPPLLKSLMIERFGVGGAAAYWFVSINLLGAIAAVPLLRWLRRFVSPTRILIAAAAADAILLLALSQTTSFATALWLRGFEGVADLLMLAVLLDLVAKSGGATGRGRRMGLGATTLLLGLGLGAMIGARFGTRPETAFAVGAGSCALLAALALIFSRTLGRAVAVCPAVSVVESLPRLRRPLWPVVSMMGGDRMLAGVLTVSMPLLLSQIGWSSVEVGWIIAVPLLLMAMLAWPAGALGDQIGNLQLRAVAGLVYAISLAALPAAALASVTLAIVVAVPLGMSAAALMATTMALAARTGRGSVAMAAMHAGGSVGFLVGVAGSGALMVLVGGLMPDAGAYALVFVLFALFHVALTGMAALTMFRVPSTAP